MKNPYELAKNILLASDDTMKTKTVTDKFTSIDLYGTSTRENDTRDGGDSSFHLENESGSGDITLYRVFPGIELVYNDMHMAYCNKDQQPAPHIMELNYCKEGRSECLFRRHQYCYYHGITVTIDFSAITEEMKNVLELLSVDINRIKALSQADEFTIIRANATIEHIFSELYKVPAAIRRGYIRVKVLELLLVLTELKPEEDLSKHTYFPAVQIETIKKIHAFLVENFSEHYTIDELSRQFQISPTVMKKCFRGVYGDSIYAYMKRYRLQVAEQLLRESNLKIGEIAARVGYLNPNKFTSAFCAEYGAPPTAYRKKV